MRGSFLVLALGLVLLPACGGDDDGGGTGGSSSGGTGGATTGGTGGSSTGGTGGTSTGGTGGTSTGGTGGTSTGGTGGTSTGGASGGGGSSGAATGGTGGSSGAATGGTGGTSTGGTGGTAGASACNTLVNDGADVPEVAGTGAPPTMTGGAIADGTWVLTARTDWQGTCGCTSRQKLSVSGATMQLVRRTNSEPDQRMNAAVTLSGNQITLDLDCPGPLTQSLTYTATSTELSVFDASDQSLHVYTKQ